jgi:ABC-type Zn uptake system ZnuABC Zn-binding protein ZnuA
MLSRRRFLHTLPLTAGALVSCSKPDPPERYQLPATPLEVLTTTVQAADLIREIGGEAVHVRSLIPPDANPHLWQPLAAELAEIQLADVFFLSGLGLESRFTTDLDELRRRGLSVGVLANGLEDEDILLQSNGKPDPHFWLNPLLWAKASQYAASVLAEVFPAAKFWFGDRSHEYVIRLEKLHSDTTRDLVEIPSRLHYLLSSHDSMAYFGHTFGLEVRSMASASGEAPAQPSQELRNWISEHRIRALFREYLADLQTIKAIARPLSLNSDVQIFSLSLASPGTRLPGVASELEVDRYLAAWQYTSEAILGRLALG